MPWNGRAVHFFVIGDCESACRRLAGGEKRGETGMKRLIFLAMAGLLAGVATHTGAMAQSTQGRSPTAGCSEDGPLPNQVRCFLGAAEAEGDVGLCEGAYDFAVRFNCVSLFAEHSGDPVSCGRIPIRNNRMLVLRDSCISGVAVATRMPEMCEQVQLDAVRDVCFLTHVVELNATPDLCRHITRSAMREICSRPPAKPQ